MGIFPIWGLQLMVAIALAIYFRLNKALVVVAANISIPPMIPAIIFLSHFTGKLWMGDHAVDLTFTSQINLDMVKDSFLQYVVGAITLSIVAGLAFGGIAFLWLRRFRNKSASV